MWEVEHAPSWLLNALSTESHDRLLKIAIILWGIWFFRNKRVWENKEVTPEFAMEWSNKQFANWLEAKEKVQPAQTHVSVRAQEMGCTWSLPVMGSLKLNVDASVFRGESSFSIGMIMRNHIGEFISGRVIKKEGTVSVFEAEVVVIQEALSWIDDNPNPHICIETDSLMAAQAINNGIDNQLEVGNVIESCRLKLAGRNGRLVFHIRKLANRVAHLMARVPCMLNSFSDFVSPPHVLLETLVFDSLS